MAAKQGTNTGIPDLSFSWKRATELSATRQRFARQTGILTTKGGLEKKIGRMATKVYLSMIIFCIVIAGAAATIALS